jgi:hypothetical protein
LGKGALNYWIKRAGKVAMVTKSEPYNGKRPEKYKTNLEKLS